MDVPEYQPFTERRPISKMIGDTCSESAAPNDGPGGHAPLSPTAFTPPLRLPTVSNCARLCERGQRAQGIVWFCKVQLGAELHGEPVAPQRRLRRCESGMGSQALENPKPS